MSELRDFTGKNRKFTGTEGERISLGSTAERIATQGTIRFNSTTNLMEYYSGTDWKAIDAPPVITSFSISDPAQTNVTSGRIISTGGGTVTISVNGSLFDSTGANVTLVGSGETLTPDTITRNSANLLTCVFTKSEFDTSNDPYTLKVTNGSGLSAELVDALTTDTAVVFTNAADTIYSVANGVRSSGTIPAADLCGATDADGDTITYSVSSGSLPTGFTLDTADGSIDWSSVAQVGSDTTTTFSITATTTFGAVTRQFKITVEAPVVTQYTSTGAFTFSVPSGVTSVSALVIAGGGGGGTVIGGGGGAGGMVETTSYPVTPGGSVPGNVGGGGAGRPPDRRANGDNGSNSVFGNITSYGGGGGASWSTNGVGSNGGSGGGATHGTGGPVGSGGNSTQTSFSPVGATGYGNPGFDEQPANDSGGAGGGAGSGGPVNTHSRTGGNGRVSNITGSPVTYAGGGGSGNHGGGANTTGGTGGGGHGYPGGGNAGAANRGSGGGGGFYPPDQTAGSGGSGIVIVSY